MLKKLRALTNQDGDTIIEVMIVLAVLGLAISISYATANRSLLNARQAQENSVASEIAQAQVEGLDSLGCTSGDPACDPTNVANQSYQLFHQPGAFCLDSSNNIQPSTNAACKVDSLYQVQVTYNPSTSQTGYFEVLITWPDVLEGTDTVRQDYTIPSVASIVGGVVGGGGGGGGGGGIAPAMATTGCTGPIGINWSGKACESGDSIAVTVSGVLAGDKCVIKADRGDNSGATMLTKTASGTSCTGSFGMSRFGSGQTDYLTAYVTDAGNNYQSNSISLNSWANTPTSYACSWNDPTAHKGYSNWYFTVNGNGCLPGTTCYQAGGACGTYAPTFNGYEEFDTACQYGSIYVYGSTWTGSDYTGRPCPPGSTQISMATEPPPGSIGPPGEQIAAAIAEPNGSTEDYREA